MKPLHAGTNYKTLLPFFKKMRQTGQTIFKAGLGGSRLIFEDQGYTFGDYGHVYRIRYAESGSFYFDIAMNDETRTVTPLRYCNRNAVSLVNKIADLTEIQCFWDWDDMTIPKPDNLRKADQLLWEWLDKLVHREYYNARWA